MKLLAVGCNLPKNLMCARGAIEVDCPKTKILFSRFKFQHNDIDSFALADNIRSMCFLYFLLEVECHPKCFAGRLKFQAVLKSTLTER